MDMRLICGHAIEFCNFTTQQNPDGRLKREVNYSEEEDSFLSTQIKVKNDGKMYSSFYRKKPKKRPELSISCCTTYFSLKYKVLSQAMIVDRSPGCNGYDNPS